MSGPLPLSLCVITRDAAAEIADCLASAAFAGEVVVVDSGSRDDTVEIARRRGARVIEREWPGFGAQKQFAVGAATHDWVLCLDADERVTPELAASIARALGCAARGGVRVRAPQPLPRPLARARRGLSGLERAAVRPAPRALERRSRPRARALRRPRRRASPATCCTRRPNRSTTISRSRTATRRCRPRRCTRAASGRGSRGSCCRRSRASSASTS